MVIDCHVHISAFTGGRGSMSQRLLHSLPFRFMRWRLGIKGENEQTDLDLEERLDTTVNQTPELEAAVVLAFDAVYTPDCRLDAANTHFFVSNDYVIDLAARHPRLRFGASVNPYRKDAVAEVERCIAAGAVLLKWLPIVQGFNPADPRCFPIYDLLAHHKLPLLSHTGGEKALPVLDLSLADPMLLLPAIQRGVTVIAAHCGTRSGPTEPDYLPQFIHLALDHENVFGDTAALNLPVRCYAWEQLLRNPVLRTKLVHGSDWPIIALPSPTLIGARQSYAVMRERNWMRRDILIKQMLGLDEAYWRRAAQVLRLS